MFFAARIGMLFALAPLLLGAYAAPRLANVLARMRDASGSPYHVRIASTYRRASSSSSIVRADSQGLQFFIRQCAGPLCFGSYFDGYRIFDVNMNGTTLPRSQSHEMSLRGLRSIVSGAFLEPAFTREGGHIADAGSVKANGSVYRRLVIDQPDADGMDVLVDPNTWLVSEVRDLTLGDGMSLRDYRHVGPFTLPFETIRYGGPVTRYEERRVFPEPMTAPHGLIAQVRGGSATMRIDAASSPVGPCSVGGISTRCLLDTGNSGIAISLELAEELHAAPVGAFEVAGLGEYSTEVVRAGPLVVGNLQFPETNYVVLHDIHRFGYDVVLGADILAASRVGIDYAARQVTFNAPADSFGEAGISLVFENFVPVIPVELGTIQARLAIDTGDQSAINLAYDFYGQHSDLFKATQVQPVSGVGGSSFEYIGQIPMVTVGDFRIYSQPIGTTRTLHGTAQGHLGSGLLANFRVLLDYARSRVTLYPREGYSAVTRVPRSL